MKLTAPREEAREGASAAFQERRTTSIRNLVDYAATTCKFIGYAPLAAQFKADVVQSSIANISYIGKPVAYS